jgi:hypothetical protein
MNTVQNASASYGQMVRAKTSRTDGVSLNATSEPERHHMDFDILIDDYFLTLQPESGLAPADKKLVLSLLNDFEDEHWRVEKFENFVWDNIAQTALSARDREALCNQSRSILRESAKNLRLADEIDDFGKGSELAEIVLYGIMKHHFKALPVVPKIFYKQNTQDNAKGADSVHIVLEGNDSFTLWFGEAKFYNSIEDVRLPAIIKSIEASLRTDKLKKENTIITNTSDIDHLIASPTLLAAIKAALSQKNSIDSLKPRLHVPILLLHQCAITASSTCCSNEYRDQIFAYHLDRAHSFFKKQIERLATTVHKYSEITFHLILFPVPDRNQLVNQFSNDARHFKGEPNGHIRSMLPNQCASSNGARRKRKKQIDSSS